MQSGPSNWSFTSVLAGSSPVLQTIVYNYPMSDVTVTFTKLEAAELLQVLRHFADASVDKTPDEYAMMYVSICAKLVKALGHPDATPWNDQDMHKIERLARK